MRVTAGSMLKDQIYAMVYGQTGAGKTLLPFTLANPDGTGVGIITPEPSGPTSIVTMGYPSNTPVDLIMDNGESPFPQVISAIGSMTRDKGIRIISVDGCTGILRMAVDFYSNGEGEKQLGWEGWGSILQGFCDVEKAARRALAAGKSFIYTAWEAEPKYEINTLINQTVMKEKGGPLIKGQGKVWLPGNVDFIARQTSEVRALPQGKQEFRSKLMVYPTNEWLAKTRWKLPNPCPADLRFILKEIQSQAKAGRPLPPAPKVVAR